MAMTVFPTTAANGASVTAGGITYIYNSSTDKWAATIGVGSDYVSATTGGTFNGKVTFTKATIGAVTAIASAGVMTPDFNASSNFSITLTASGQLANPSNLTAGQSGIITITQDGTGSRTLTYGSYWKFPSGTAPTLTTAANSVDVLVYYVESATRITARLIADTK
jgi:hypothetical protein